MRWSRAYSRHGRSPGSRRRWLATSTPTPSLGKKRVGGSYRQWPCSIQSCPSPSSPPAGRDSRAIRATRLVDATLARRGHGGRYGTGPKTGMSTRPLSAARHYPQGRTRGAPCPGPPTRRRRIDRRGADPVHEAPALLDPDASAARPCSRRSRPSRRRAAPPPGPRRTGGSLGAVATAGAPRPDPTPLPPPTRGVARLWWSSWRSPPHSCRRSSRWRSTGPRRPRIGAAGLADGALDIQALLDRAQPSVVTISTGQATTRLRRGRFRRDHLRGRPHPDQRPRDRRGDRTPGSALRRREPTRAGGCSPDDDIALIRLDDTRSLPAKLGSDDTAVGDEVVAIGNALNLGGTPSVTSGIVSAKDRTIERTRRHAQTTSSRPTPPSTPATRAGRWSTPPGEVVGINTAIIDDAQNIGFAIAIDPIKAADRDLKAGRGDHHPGHRVPRRVPSPSAGRPEVLDEYGVTPTTGRS